MGGSNGYESDQPLIERLISAVVRFNALAHGLGESLDSLSQQQALGFEAVRKEFRDECRTLERAILNIGHDVEEVRKDQTDPRGVRLLDPAALEPRKNDSGGAVAIRDGKLKLALPASWAGVVFKLGMSAGVGGLALRIIQWLTTGH